MRTQKEIIQTHSAPLPIGAYSQAVKVGKTVYLAGMIGLCPVSGLLVKGGCKEQLIQIFKNLSAVCSASGGSLKNIVQLTCYLVSMDDFAQVNEVMADFFENDYPARATLAVSALPKNALAEVVSVMVLD
jgi:reactive intermediate/imine deaminase